MVNLEELFYQYNPWWEGNFELQGIIERSIYTDRIKDLYKKNTIVILTGLRRIGKTTLIKLYIKQLLESKVNPKSIFYISLDDFSLKNNSIIDIISHYRKIHRLSIDEKVYLFFDEVVYKENFHQQLKNLFDNQNVKITASSSSSSLLKDKKAFLTGRVTLLEVLPLDFNEYLIFKNISIKKRDKHLYESHFEEYMQIGGIPEYVINPDREYLISLIYDIIYKDIISFHGIKNPQIIKDYFLLLMERSGKQISINKVSKILKISPDTANRYLLMFEETYLIYTIARYGNTNETVLSPKKIYAADIGMKNIFTGFRDKGSIFENYIFLQIKSKNPSYIYQNGIELDFITQDKKLIEVKYGRSFTAKQKKLFEQFNASSKTVIQSIADMEKLQDI